MPYTKSGKKTLRSSLKKRVFNDRRRRTMREAIKEIRELAEQGKNSDAKGKLGAAYKAIDKAKKRGIIKLRTASRKKSLVARMAHASK